jgi:hypothetical protein
MNLKVGSHTFRNVQVPILWGTRAILQDSHGRLSVVDLSGARARLEILANSPAPGADFRPRIGGFSILGGEELYSFNVEDRSFEPVGLRLPPIQIGSREIRIGTNRISNAMVTNAAVGIHVDGNSISIGAPLPHGLARLVV